MNINEKTPKEKAIARLHDLLNLQKEITGQFGEEDYNVFVFGSYPTIKYDEEKSDIDIAVYTQDFDLYKRLSCYLEEYFNMKNIPSDIFYIDSTVEAPIYCAPLKSRVQFTDYYPEQLVEFRERCEQKLKELKEMVAV
ncbi:MAG: nucleotidyltransferase domain-containing protein [Lachnospiraceae bacterium]